MFKKKKKKPSERERKEKKGKRGARDFQHISINRVCDETHGEFGFGEELKRRRKLKTLLLIVSF